MAGTSVSFAGNSLQTSSILTDDIDHHSLPTKTNPQYAFSHADQSAIPHTSYPNKIISMTGMIIGTSIADLDGKIDTFKGYFNGKDQNLDIGYNGSTRRYIATVNKISITRPGGLYHAIFAVEFTCNIPFGMDTSTTSIASGSAQTSNPETYSYTFLGTAPFQLPVITVTYSSCVTSTTNLVTNPGFETDLSGWTSGGIGTATRVTAQHHSGSAAMQMVNASSSPIGAVYGWEFYEIGGLIAGQSYTVTAWVKGNAGSEQLTSSTTGGSTSLSLTTSFQQLTFSFVATAASMELDFTSTTSGATWFLDDVSVLANTSATVNVGNAGNGQAIFVTRNFAANDVLIVDAAAKTVTVNGIAVAYSGAFPEFPPGAQQLYVNDTFTSRSFAISALYTVRYL